MTTMNLQNHKQKYQTYMRSRLIGNMFKSNKSNSCVQDIFGSKVLNGDLKISKCSSIFQRSIQQPTKFSALQLLGMFLDYEKYSLTVKFLKNRPTAKKKFQWRFINTIGESILQVQQYLEQRDGLRSHIILDYSQIFYFSQYLFVQMQQKSENKEFISFRNMLFNIFKGQYEDDIERVIQIYVKCMRMWRMNIASQAKMRIRDQDSRKDIIIKYPSNNKISQDINRISQIEQDQDINPIFNKNVDHSSHPNPRIGPYSVIRMPPSNLTVFKQKCKEKKKRKDLKQIHNQIHIDQSQQNQLKKIISERDKKLESKLSQGNKKQSSFSYESFCSDEFIKLDQEQPGNSMNLKQKRYEKRSVRPWTPEQQLHFCKLYIQFDSQEMIRQFLEKQYGQDPKWATNMQVDSKIQVLAARVYKKFMSMQTTNQSIVKFKGLKGLIISSDSITVVLRRQLFKKLAAIYIAIQSCPVSTKKLVISQKIEEILQMCSSYLNIEN